MTNKSQYSASNGDFYNADGDIVNLASVISGGATRTLRFLTNTVDYDIILSEATFKTKLKELMDWSDPEYATNLALGFNSLNLQVVLDTADLATTVTLNTASAEYLMKGEIWTNGGYSSVELKTLKVSTDATAGILIIGVL
jgi:hypothetical protein